MAHGKTISINALLDQLLRENVGDTVLASYPRIVELVDTAGRFLQKSDRVPLTDAVLAICDVARRLMQKSAGSKWEYVVALDKPALETLLVQAVCIKRQGAIELSERLEKDVNEEWSRVLESYDAAHEIASSYKKDKRMKAEEYEEALSRSPDPKITRRFLSDTDPRGPRLIGPKGPLRKMPIRYPATLRAGKPVTLKVRVLEVRDQESLARVEIVHFDDSYSEIVLSQQSGPIRLFFERKGPHRDDLLVAQYLQMPIAVCAFAECATDRRYARQASLNLAAVIGPRLTIDKLHDAALQLQSGLFGDL